MRLHHSLVLLAVLSLAPMVLRAQPSETFVVHGRLICGNGAPSCRIWVVGSKRILGVHELQDEIPDMPERLVDMLAYGKSPNQYRTIYADFQVAALTQDKPGHMRIIRVISASKIVVIKNNKIILTATHL